MYCSKCKRCIHLYYKTKTLVDGSYVNFTEVLNFIPYIGSTSPFSGISITPLTDPSYTPIPHTSVTFVGYRVPNTTIMSTPIYNETVTIVLNQSTLTASASYEDTGSGFETTLPSQEYTVTGATGLFKAINKMIIKFDNVTHTRVVHLINTRM